MNKIYRFLLIIFSFLNLIKIKFLGIKSANYFIIVDKHIDRRSLYYFGLKDCKSTLNLIRLSKLNFVIFINLRKIASWLTRAQLFLTFKIHHYYIRLRVIFTTVQPSWSPTSSPVHQVSCSAS